MSGKDYLVHISSDGTSTGSKIEVEYQGDLSINEGRTVERQNYKNGSKTAQGAEGWSAQFEMALEAPLPAGIAAVLTASDDDEDAYFFVESTKTGGRKWEGPMKCITSSFSFPTSGQEQVTVDLSENGTIVVGTTT